MSVNDGVRAVKEERRTVARRLKQLDGILAGFANLSSTRPRANGVEDKPKQAKRTRKSSGNGRKRARKPIVEASLSAAAQD